MWKVCLIDFRSPKLEEDEHSSAIIRKNKPYCNRLHACHWSVNQVHQDREYVDQIETLGVYLQI